jgi:hypothetical protein
MSDLSKNKRSKSILAKKILLVFVILLLLIDISGGIDLVNLKIPITIIMFLTFAAISYPFIYIGIIIGADKGEEEMWALVGGLIGLAVFILIFALFIIYLANISV